MFGSLVSACDNQTVIVDFDEKYRTEKPFGSRLDIFLITDLLDSSICSGPFDMESLSTSADGETIRSSGTIISSRR
jgi:hypothetical protein